MALTSDPGTPPPRQKQFRERRNPTRKEQERGEWREAAAGHVLEVDVEINHVTAAAPRPLRPGSKRVGGAHPGGAAAGGSPSRASLISDAAAEELSELRSYYSKQLRRINYVSHEHLGPPAPGGVLACIRAPLRSLRLPRGLAIAQSARSLWTRVSGRRKRPLR